MVRKLREYPVLKEEAARWFSRNWGIPVSAYEESIGRCVDQKTGVPQWYVVLDDQQRVIAGAGVIENDFHSRKDLTPNVCALFVEEAYRKQGIACQILDTIRNDMCSFGIETLYLVTDHTEFYEKCGWNFLTIVADDEGCEERMYEALTKKESFRLLP